MKTLTAVVLCLALSAPVYHSFGQTAPINPEPQDEGGYEKRAQSGMKFLSISVDPRVAAMGDAGTSLELGAVSMFYNPAGMAYLDGTADISVSHVNWFADIGFNQAGLAFRPFEGRYGVFGVSVMAADFGEFEGTIRADNEQGFLETGGFSPTAMAVGLGYAKALTDRFSIGGNVKYVTEDLGASAMSLSDPENIESDRVMQENTASTPAFDFGVRYNTGFRGLTLAMMTRNFAPAVRYEEESFELPMTLSVGASMDLMNLYPSLQDDHSLLVSVNGSTPRDFYEQVSVGAEYVFMNTLALRAGYVTPTDEQGLSLGAGLRMGISGMAFRADYAYSQFGTLGSVQRFAFQFGF